MPRGSADRDTKRTSWRVVVEVLVLAAAYVAVAKLGLRFATATSSVTLVWPPSGLSLAALLLLGRSRWPGIALGALVANASTPGVGLLVAGGIAVGNTLEAWIAARLLERSGFRRSLERIFDVLALVALGALVSTLASATLGVASLRLGGMIPADAVVSTWRVWWLGDLMGDLIFAPLVLTFSLVPGDLLRPRRLIELGALLVAVVAAALSAFGLVPWVSGLEFPEPYAIFPLLTWAALRFGPRGAASCNFIVSVVSIAATVQGVGPFASETLNESLFQLQTFMALIVLTSLLLGASVAERDRAIALRDEFLLLASHELNTPLTSLHLDVVSLGRMLARGDAPPEKLRHRVAHTEGQVNRLRDLVTRLLDSTRIAAGHLEIVRSSVDFAALVRETAKRFAPQLEEAGRALAIDAPATLVGHWDPDRLELVVSNLLSNAVKYGGDEPIALSLRATETEAVLRVQDHGIGIAPDQQERVFGRFERGVSSQSYPGFGLGLWITQATVAAMGGRIEIASELGAGTTFTVTLPRASTRTTGAPSGGGAAR